MKHYLGQRPYTQAIKDALANLAFDPAMLHADVIVHHYTDAPDRLQLEVEYRCPYHGIRFRRIIFNKE